MTQSMATASGRSHKTIKWITLVFCESGLEGFNSTEYKKGYDFKLIQSFLITLYYSVFVLKESNTHGNQNHITCKIIFFTTLLCGNILHFFAHCAFLNMLETLILCLFKVNFTYKTKIWLDVVHKHIKRLGRFWTIFLWSS